jgi:hypothetical protein
VFSPSALPADATHRDHDRVRDVDARQGDVLLNEQPSHNLDANWHLVDPVSAHPMSRTLIIKQ